jgi:hypothetical protein
MVVSISFLQRSAQGDPITTCRFLADVVHQVSGDCVVVDLFVKASMSLRWAASMISANE